MNTEKRRFPIDIGSLWGATSTPPKSLPASQPAAERRFVFETGQSKDGRTILRFPFASISDTHWGTMVSRAKRLAHFLHNMDADLLYGLGDMIDFEYLRHKRHWKIGPWHRQGIAHMLRKADSGTEVLYFRGNHETGMRSLDDEKAGKASPVWRDGTRSLYGIRMVYEHSRSDARGRSILSKHGDVYDQAAMRSEKIKPLVDQLIVILGTKEAAERFIYEACSMTYESLYGIDWGLRQFPPLENYSFAAHFKHFFKEEILSGLGVRKVIAQTLDDSSHDVMIYGHSHMPGFEWTPGGKLLINDGCSTEHVNALVQDKNGTFAILTWHKHGVEVEEEPASPFTQSVKYSLSWDELGLQNLHDRPPVLEDAATLRADRLLRLVYRLAPPLERSELKDRQVRHGAMLEDFEIARSLGYQPQPFEIFAAQRIMTDLRREEERLRRLDSAVPRPALPD
jgi:UDP-2,3-diacylglucosamine pyrophosphatase LpxH